MNSSTITEAGSKYPIIEIFGPTIQGEGPLCGHQTYFVRLGGCDYRCSWCDTLYAVLPEEVKANSTRMSVAEIRQALANLSGASPWVTISGGNPCLFDLEELIHSLRAFQKYKVAIETQGTRCPDWLKWCDLVVVSPKPPSSGMITNWEQLGEFTHIRHLPGQLVFKVVVFDDADYDYARRVHTTFPWVPFYMSVGTNLMHQGREDIRNGILARMRWLVERTMKDDILRNVVILPQLHILVWGQKRGV